VGPTTKQELLHRAVQLIRREQLARQLGVPETALDTWIRGDETILDRVASDKK
jgi:hypothetical protein